MKELFANLIYMRLIKDIDKTKYDLTYYLIFYFLIQFIPISSIIYRLHQGWNDLNQLIKISDLNRDLNQMIFFTKIYS